MRTPRYHHAGPNTVGLWQFDGDLLDSGPNGLDLSVLAGTEKYSVMLGPIRGVCGTNTVTDLVVGRTVWDEVLAITGDITVMFLGTTVSCFVSALPIVYFGATGETLETNTLWQVSGDTTGFKFLSESGAGVNSQYIVSNLFAGEYHDVVHYCGRKQNGYASLFVDGRKVGTSAAPLTTPTGGTSGVLKVGGIYQWAMSSLRIDNVALSDDEIRRCYNMSIGEWQGWRT